MKRITITVNPIDLVGDQRIREVDDTGHTIKRVRHETIVGYTIVAVEESLTGEFVLVLQKHRKKTKAGMTDITLSKTPVVNLDEMRKRRYT